jgi:glycosyltransferase involved in cell wall biosynthesis
MRIASITPSLIPSTTAHSIQAVKASHALATLGHTVRVITPGTGEVDWNELAEPYELTTRFEVCRGHSIPSLKRYDFIWNSLNAARIWHADLVYTWLPQCAWLAGLRGIPSVLEMHDRLTGKLGPWFFNRYLGIPTPKRVLVITRALKAVLERQVEVSIDPSVISIAPNGVDMDRYADLPKAAAARALLDLPQQFTAVYTGHFYAGRGMDLLFELAANLPDVSFLWVGGSHDAVSAWKKQVESAGLKNLRLTGFVPKAALPLYQSAGDVLLMPYETTIAGSSGGNSAEICSPMKMFDYLATGRVILTSDLPVLHEVLNPGNALFCPPRNVEAWAQALRSVQQDPAMAAQLAAQARQDAARYTWLERARQALQGLV